MESIEFINRYELYLDEISEVVRHELLQVIEELRQMDPHDIVRPDSFFESESHGKGIVWNMFIKRVRKHSKVE